MSTPHVAGLVAYLLGLDSTLSPAEVETTIKARALTNVLTGVREYRLPTRRPLRSRC
jgi:cerevisin